MKQQKIQRREKINTKYDLCDGGRMAQRMRILQILIPLYRRHMPDEYWSVMVAIQFHIQTKKQIEWEKTVHASSLAFGLEVRTDIVPNSITHAVSPSEMFEMYICRSHS